LRQKNEELPQVDIKTFGVYNLFSAQMKQPIYYRLINGNITNVKFISLYINEMKVKTKDFLLPTKDFSVQKILQ
jgi:hypothetical protein